MFQMWYMRCLRKPRTFEPQTKVMSVVCPANRKREVESTSLPLQHFNGN